MFELLASDFHFPPAPPPPPRKKRKFNSGKLDLGKSLQAAEPNVHIYKR